MLFNCDDDDLSGSVKAGNLTAVEGSHCTTKLVRVNMWSELCRLPCCCRLTCGFRNVTGFLDHPFDVQCQLLYMYHLLQRLLWIFYLLISMVSQWTAIIPLNSINHLVVIEDSCVFFEVRTEFLNTVLTGCPCLTSLLAPLFISTFFSERRPLP
jgi:hypothetical protein